MTEIKRARGRPEGTIKFDGPPLKLLMTAAMREALETRAATEGRTASELARAAIERYLRDSPDAD